MDISVIKATFQTADNGKLNDIIRLLLGLKGIAGNEVAIDYQVMSLKDDWQFPREDDPDELPF